MSAPGIPMAMLRSIKLVEVGPRDGLQNERSPIDLATKLGLIERLANAGVRHIEAAAFVSPRWVPQMADSAELMRCVPRREGLRYSALTPNLKGLEAALEVGCDEVAVIGSASELFAQKNINCSIRESLERFRSVVELATEHGLRVRGYASCALGCPYEGKVSPDKVGEVAWWLHDMGCAEIAVSDTIGTGTPTSTRAMLLACLQRVPAHRLACHFHDTYGRALANIVAALDMGVRTFDASVAGLGGCPYAAGASGNVATEDVVHMLQAMGYDTGIWLPGLIDAGAYICTALGRDSGSRVAMAMQKKVHAVA